MPNKTAPPPADAIRARREAMTPEEIAERIVGEVQLTDNTWQQADEVGIELRQLIVDALRAVATETAEKCAGMAFDSGEGIGEHISDSIRARFGLA